MNLKKKRRLETRTDYKAREIMLRSGKPRIVFRKTNRYILGQYVISAESQDKIITGVISRDLLEYGWPENAEGSLKSIPAAYLTGFLLGKKIQDKDDNTEAILDMGMIRNVKKSKTYSFLKGVIDSGLELNADSKIFPEEAKLEGSNISKKIDVKKIKQTIEKKFA